MARMPDTEKRESLVPILDLEPDAWERFEATVDQVVKAPPQHRQKDARHADQATRTDR
jgi:hypothetical protein